MKRLLRKKSKQIETLENILSEKETNTPIEEVLTKMETKLETFEIQLSTMKNCLIEKDDYIHKLESKVKDIEERLHNFHQIKTNEQNIK